MMLHARKIDDLRLILLAIEDITERCHFEEKVRPSQERLREVLETDAVGVVFYDESGAVTASDDVMLRMTGYSRSEIAVD